MSLDALLAILTWVFWGPQFVFWVTTGMMVSHRRAGVTPSDRLRAYFRLARRCLWPSYAGYCLAGLFDMDSVSDAAFTIPFLALVGYLNWMDWKRGKGLDDDDWMKKLVEKGLGVVERVGNKLAVVVPAPAGA
jgi:hypothetical protein